MRAMTIHEISGKLSVGKAIRVKSNIPFFSILDDLSLSAYVNLDFGYLKVFFQRSSGDTVTVFINATSKSRNMHFKRAATVIGNFTTYATFDKVLIHRATLWADPNLTGKGKKELVSKLKNMPPKQLLTYVLKKHPSRRKEIFELKEESRLMLLTFTRLSARLHLRSQSKDTSYLTPATKTELLLFLTKQGLPCPATL